MQFFVAAQANTVTADLVDRATGDPITSGTVSFYLMALTGSNAGKWFRTSDDSWQVAEAIAGTGAHTADGHWTCSIDLAAWTASVRYIVYAKESGDLHIPYCEPVETNIADTVWDEVLSLTAHNTTNSAGKRLRLLGMPSLLEGQIEDPITIQSVTLGAEAPATARIYNENLLTITSGTGGGSNKNDSGLFGESDGDF
jgi:hypothetical protein